MGTGSWPAAGALWVGQTSPEKCPSGTDPLDTSLAGSKSPISKDEREGSINQSRRLGLHLLLVIGALRKLCYCEKDSTSPKLCLLPIFGLLRVSPQEVPINIRHLNTSFSSNTVSVPQVLAPTVLIPPIFIWEVIVLGSWLQGLSIL